MLCPYCSKTMKTGKIAGDRYPLKWIPEDKYHVLFSAFQKGIKLTNYWKDNSVHAYYFEDCQKIIIDMQSENHQ